MDLDVADTELKAKHRAMWGNGNYPLMVDTFLLPIGQRLVDAAGIDAGVRVLDVAAGTGNASIPAAQRGARVTASDLTPDLLAAGSRRPEADGLDIEWVEADAENLPFERAPAVIVNTEIPSATNSSTQKSGTITRTTVIITMAAIPKLSRNSASARSLSMSSYSAGCWMRSRASKIAIMSGFRRGRSCWLLNLSGIQTSRPLGRGLGKGMRTCSSSWR